MKTPVCEMAICTQRGGPEACQYSCDLKESSGQDRADREFGEVPLEWQITFDAIQDPIMILDRQFKIVRGNAATAAFFQVSLDELYGMHCFQLMHGSNTPIDDCPFKQSIESKKHEEIEYFDVQREAWYLVSVDPVIGHCGEITGIIHSIKDITCRKLAEKAIRTEKKRLRSVLKITAQKASSLKELLDKALDEAIALSDSQYGYIYFYNETDQEFTLHAWSTEVMKECRIPNPPTAYQLDKTGLWGEPVRQRKPIIVNDFEAPHPWKKGYPEGHAPLCRYMTLPVFCDGQIVAVVGVANKTTDYTELDVRQLTLMMDSIWEIAERKRVESAVRILAGKLLNAQEVERRRLAREMHDDLTQRIAGLAIEAGKLEQESSNPKHSLTEKIKGMKDELIQLSQDVHALSRRLHPSILDDLGFIDAMRSECASFSQREGIPIRFVPQDIPEEIPKEVALGLYRIAQESLRNIAKHAAASQVHVSLIASDDSVLLSIEDTGIGFRPNESQGKPGLGLASMEERARLIGGELSIRSEPGRGTLVEVWAPCS